MIMINKACSKCAMTKSVDDFGNIKSSRDGKSSWCKSCHAIARKNWAVLNKEKVRAKSRKYMTKIRLTNKKRVLDTQSKYYSKNPDAKSRHDKTYREHNSEKINAQKRVYYASNAAMILAKPRKQRIENPERVRELARKYTAQRRAAKYGATPVWANNKAIESIYVLARRMTEQCGAIYHVDHILPLKSKIVCGLHCEDNLQVMLAAKNLSKGNRLLVREWTEKTTK